MKNCIIRMAAFAALCATAAAPALADRTVSADCTLAGDEVWRVEGVAREVNGLRAQP